MDWHRVALGSAGIIGSGVAVAHGVIIQRVVVSRVDQLLAADAGVPDVVRRLTPALLHFSTFSWLVAGLVLIALALEVKLDFATVVFLLAGSGYLYGVAGNFWATQGRHPGWALYVVALVLMAFWARGARL